MFNDLIYVIAKENHNVEEIKNTLTAHPEIKFVSLVGIDLSGTDTDERIPMKVFLEDIEGFLKGAIQTDGSSVVLPGIASLNNAKVDMVADSDVNWFVDYNYDFYDDETGKPVGTLRIPCFYIHEGKPVDSRHVLKRAVNYVKSNLVELFTKYPEAIKPYGITIDDIEEVYCTSATELEFWVSTPEVKVEFEELSTSQVLQEQYWTRTKASVRTAMEESLLLMEAYGLEPEMGHKEVGGMKAQLADDGSLTNILEQLEIDWKYADATQAADNELFVRILIRETFRRNGLDVSFQAKPITGVAGNGEHTHMSVTVKTKAGKRINLFAPTEKHFLSIFGYASLMGVLKNYEVINPFVSSTNDSLRRLKPGFEAPVCIVTSVGHSVEIPSRNRTILVGVVRDITNPLGTRFELRAPNPHSNTYLVLAALFMAASEGIRYALNNGKTADDLLAELSKDAGANADYLEKDRAYRSEEDVFEDYDAETRDRLFGKAPATVYENLQGFVTNAEKLKMLQAGDVFTPAIINSFKLGAEKRWVTELTHRIMNIYLAKIRTLKKLHCEDCKLEIDKARWNEINDLRKYIAKDTDSSKSLFTKIVDATTAGDYSTVSALQVELDAKFEELKALYATYTKNIL